MPDLPEIRKVDVPVPRVSGFPYQGQMFLCEMSTEWYDRYQRLLEMADEYGGIPFDELEGSDGKDEPF